MCLIDTNIFLEILLDQEKSTECSDFIESLQYTEVLFYVSSFTFHSIEVIMETNDRHEQLIDFLHDIHKTSGINRIETNTLEELEAIKEAKILYLDYDDAIQHYICKKHNLKIVSFDKHFDLTDVERVTPKDVLL